jgi:hypothetical protein
MLIYPDWLNMLVERGENKVTSFSVGKYDFTAAYLDTSVLLFFKDRDASMNNSRGQKQIYPSAGLRASCLSRGRKRIRI